MTLLNCIDELLRSLAHGTQRPASDRINVVEIGPRAPIDARGRFRVKMMALMDPAAYESRFQELMEQGPPWINVSCYGVLGGALVIGIEVPERSSKASPRTSVNYSGPPAVVLEHGWDAGEVLCIE